MIEPRCRERYNLNRAYQWMRAVATSVVPSPQVPGSRSAARTISEFPVSEPLLVGNYLLYCLGLCGAFVRSFSSGSGPPDGGGEPRELGRREMRREPLGL